MEGRNFDSRQEQEIVHFTIFCTSAVRTTYLGITSVKDVTGPVQCYCQEKNTGGCDGLKTKSDCKWKASYRDLGKKALHDDKITLKLIPQNIVRYSAKYIKFFQDKLWYIFFYIPSPFSRNSREVLSLFI
jgi:hypothetical protein